ncbi:MAG TPA: hydroxymethylbilane synthase [Polyangiaceae bacterium]|nr:hydroxymethylbilane synthase [Polyangiaceae bacterium]
MAKHKLVLATRKSALALAQSRAFAKTVQALHPKLEIEELTVTTTGDRVQDRLLSEVGGKGLFVKEIEEALLDGRADLAVHSLKDVPAEMPSGLVIGCYPRREDPRDVLISRTGAKLVELPAGSVVGTSSLRRRMQLEKARPDLRIVGLRGNVDTRLRKCREGEMDAIVLARAGLLRLGLTAEVTEVLEPEIMLPAVGQGALGIEYRAADAEVAALLDPLSHPDTKIAVLAERATLKTVEGSCHLPVAAFAMRDGNQMFLRGFLAEADGSRAREHALREAWPSSEVEAEGLGQRLGEVLARLDAR